MPALFAANRTVALLANDPALAPYAQQIANRVYRYRGMRLYIDEMAGSLLEYANMHKELGINYDTLKEGFWYREWAPGAHALFLTGDFNGWSRTSHPLTQRGDRIWEIFIPDGPKGFKHGQKYKVTVLGKAGPEDRIPAFSTYLVQDSLTKAFTPQLWLPEKPYQFQHQFRQPRPNPIIYEAHVGMATEGERVGTYREFADDRLAYIASLGYDTIQLMAVQEHPYYGSYGYHVSSLFAPSSRFGTPCDLKYLVDKAHGLGLAIIMDIVHSHAVKNRQEGLDHFDDSNPYFHLAEHPAWDSKLYDYSRWEVVQFLLSNVRYWLEEFQFDGFRWDGVTSMLYKHHGLGIDFTTYADYFNDAADTDAALYLSLANEVAHTLAPHSLCIAEDMSGMPGLGRPPLEGGLGFDARLAMGLPDFWIRQLKEVPDEAWDLEKIYTQLLNRRADERTIAYVESHDQALVGDQTLAFRMIGGDMYAAMDKGSLSLTVDRGIALHKMIRLLTIALGGEGYLTFMGNEFGHPEWIDFPREGNNWSYAYARRQWSLAQSPFLRYTELLEFDRDMIALIKNYNLLKAPKPVLLNVDDLNKTLAFERAGLIWVFNFHPTTAIADYKVGVPTPGKYTLHLNSDDAHFGGFGRNVTDSTHFTDASSQISFYNLNRTAQVFGMVE
jgi:1,4-alpha-glucan branching enzyme